MGKIFGVVLQFFYNLLGSYTTAFVLLVLLLGILAVPIDFLKHKEDIYFKYFMPLREALKAKHNLPRRDADSIGMDKTEYHRDVQTMYREYGYKEKPVILQMVCRVLIILISVFVIAAAFQNPLTDIVGLPQQEADKCIAIANTTTTEFYTSHEVKAVTAIQQNKQLFESVLEQEEIAKIKDLNFTFFDDINLFVIPLEKIKTMWPVLLAVFLVGVCSQYILYYLIAKNNNPGLFFILFYPLIKVGFSCFLPAAVAAYWIIRSVFVCIEHFIFEKIASEEKIHKQLEEHFYFHRND